MKCSLTLTRLCVSARKLYQLLPHKVLMFYRKKRKKMAKALNGVVRLTRLSTASGDHKFLLFIFIAHSALVFFFALGLFLPLFAAKLHRSPLLKPSAYCLRKFKFIHLGLRSLSFCVLSSRARLLCAQKLLSSVTGAIWVIITMRVVFFSEFDYVDETTFERSLPRFTSYSSYPPESPLPPCN